jgi:hypothetical protein
MAVPPNEANFELPDALIRICDRRITFALPCDDLLPHSF